MLHDVDVVLNPFKSEDNANFVIFSFSQSRCLTSMVRTNNAMPADGRPAPLTTFTEDEFVLKQMGNEAFILQIITHDLEFVSKVDFNGRISILKCPNKLCLYFFV